MRRLFAILGLLTLLIGTAAGELPVIKDSEAVRCVGKYVEVRGLVGSVTSSPLGTVFINFGRDYPNQTFAGFIAAGSKIATDQQIATLQGKTIGITGKVQLCRGKPEIKVLSINQINGVDSHPVWLFDLRWKTHPGVDNLRSQEPGIPQSSGPLKSIVKRED